jgi:hypothetical protein
VASAASLLALAGFCYAQFPSAPEGVTVMDSKFGDGVKLSWKEVCSMVLGVLNTKPNGIRTTFARPPRAFAATPVTFIFRQEVLMTWAKSRIILSIPSFGL